MEKAIIISGIGRCGTSWLQDWLLDHPLTYGEHNESRMFALMASTCHENFSWLDQQTSYSVVGKFVYEWFSLASCRQGKPYLVEKTPRNRAHFHTINKMMQPFCEVYFIDIYRDGRNVVESFRRQSWSHRSPQRIVNGWIKLMKRMLNNESPSNVLHVKYEDLVKHPEISRSITSFCKIEHHHDIKPFEKMISNGLNDNMERWKTVKDPELLDCFFQMDDLLVQLGYEPTSSMNDM